MTTEVKMLGQEKKERYQGDGIIETQGAGKGFSRVSQYWVKKCMSFDEGKVKLVAEQSKIEDFASPLSEWLPVVDNSDRFAMRHLPTGKDYVPTDHALKLMAQVGKGMSEWGLRALREPIRHATKVDEETGEKVPLHQRERADAELLRDYVKQHLFHPERVDQGKPRLFRTWNDGTLRALLSEHYSIVNNLWYLNLLQQIIPGGLLSHWHGDADTIYGNILLPDSIRADSDSDYGGMLSIGNSEIGTRRISSMPSVFRAICMNGCIWDQEKGVEFDQIHRGAVDFATLAAKIRENLEAQIPLLPEGISRMLGIKAYGVGDTPIPNMLAQLAIDHSLNKRDIKGVWDEWAKEVNALGKQEGNTAFGIVAGLTRYGQRFVDSSKPGMFTPSAWVGFDKIAGSFINLSRDEWDKFRNRAANLNQKQVEKRLGELAMVAA